MTATMHTIPSIHTHTHTYTHTQTSCSVHVQAYICTVHVHVSGWLIERRDYSVFTMSHTTAAVQPVKYQNKQSRISTPDSTPTFHVYTITCSQYMCNSYTH